MKDFIITTVMVLLIGAFTFTANAQDRNTQPALKTWAKTEKQVKHKNKRRDLKININENFVKVQREAGQTLELKKKTEAKAKSEAEKNAIKVNTDLFDEFVKTVEDCEIEHNKKSIEKNLFSQNLEKALRLSTKINTKMLTDAQKVTFDANKAKLNGFLKR